MKDWQFYVALLLLVLLMTHPKENYTDSDINKLKTDITTVISDIKQNITNTNSFITTPNTRYPAINKVNQINQINVTNFDTYFDTLDVASIQQNMLLLQTTADNNSSTLNNILRNIGLNTTSSPVSVATQLNSYYSNIQTRAALNNTGRFLENDLILLKADLKQLKNITNTNKILITIIENQIAPLR